MRSLLPKRKTSAVQDQTGEQNPSAYEQSAGRNSEKTQKGWQVDIAVNFVQVPEEKMDQYQAALKWFAEEIRKNIQGESHE